MFIQHLETIFEILYLSGGPRTSVFWSLWILQLLDEKEGAGFWTLGILLIFWMTQNCLDVRDTS